MSEQPNVPTDRGYITEGLSRAQQANVVEAFYPPAKPGGRGVNGCWLVTIVGQGDRYYNDNAAMAFADAVFAYELALGGAPDDTNSDTD